MKKFEKGELIFVLTTLLFISVYTIFNLNLSFRRARDAQRRDDMGKISDALHKFQADYGFFPYSADGAVLVCKNDNFDGIYKKIKDSGKLDIKLLNTGLRKCDWGVDSFNDFLESGNQYMSTFPSDPGRDNGISYLYISNGNRFQLYSYLEGESGEVGFNPNIVRRNLNCGNKSCNYGKSSGATPLDKSIEEYELELLEMQKATGK